MDKTRNKGTGALSEPLSHTRDYDYEMVCGAIATSFPEKYQIPNENTGTQKDQGTYMCCVAEVIASIAEEWWKRELGEQEEHSEGFVYGTLRPQSLNGPGMSVADAMKFWTSIGTIPKKYFDKMAEMPEIKKIVTDYPELYEMAKKYKLKNYVNIGYADQKKRDDAIKDAITKYQYGLVAASTDYFVMGAHCIQIVGWNDEKDTYIYKNSWGAEWGKNGFGEIPKDEVNKVYLPLFEEVTVPFTDVKESDWFFNAIKHLYFSGIINGKTEDAFAPNDNITRAEASVLIYRVLEKIDERFDIFNRLRKDPNLKDI